MRSYTALLKMSDQHNITQNSEHEDFQLFHKLWISSQPSIQAYLMSLLGNYSIVEDCMQEVAIVAWQKAPTEKSNNDFLAYCIACAKRIAKSYQRKNKSGRLQILSPEVALSLAETVQLQCSEQANPRVPALKLCLEKLDEKQRALIKARYDSTNQSALQELANEHKRSIDSIYKQLERLRISLKNCVDRTLSNSHE